MLSTAAAMAAGLLLALALASGGAVNLALAVLAMLGFLTRDVAIFVVMRKLAGNKGDFAALAILGALYLAAPMLLKGLGLRAADFIFLPVIGSVAGVAMAWGQGIIAALWTMRRVQVAE
jgi:hypothetical protein